MSLSVLQAFISVGTSLLQPGFPHPFTEVTRNGDWYLHQIGGRYRTPRGRGGGGDVGWGRWIRNCSASGGTTIRTTFSPSSISCSRFAFLDSWSKSDIVMRFFYQSFFFVSLGPLKTLFFWFFTQKDLRKESSGKFKTGLRIHIHFIRIRIQHFRLNTNSDPDPIQSFNDQN